MAPDRFQISFDSVTVAFTGRVTCVPELNRVIAILEAHRELLPEEPTPLSEPEAVSPNCTVVLRQEGKAYPRTCKACGLGPCRYFDKHENRIGGGQ